VQVDILSSDDEVQEVVKFVSDNAKRVLNVDAARVIPVSSRLALDAKLAVDDGSAGEALLLPYVAQSPSACTGCAFAEVVADRCTSEPATVLWIVCPLKHWLCCMDAKRAFTDEGDCVASTAGWHSVFACSSVCIAETLL